MADVQPDLKFSKTHEWVRVEGDVAVIGISHHAQAELGDIVYLDLPEPGRILQAESSFGEIESVKAVSELFSPLSGEVTESNTGIAAMTEVVNEDPYHAGWLIKIRFSSPAELANLMSAEDYERFAGEGGH